MECLKERLEQIENNIPQDQTCPLIFRTTRVILSSCWAFPRKFVTPSIIFAMSSIRATRRAGMRPGIAERITDKITEYRKDSLQRSLP